jgi:hypothetical protein
VAEILRKESLAPVWPGDVLTVATPSFSPRMRIRVCYVKDGRLWGRECSAQGEAFGPIMAFPPENVGCEVSRPEPSRK